jgi:hypothetical protein
MSPLQSHQSSRIASLWEHVSEMIIAYSYHIMYSVICTNLMCCCSFSNMLAAYCDVMHTGWFIGCRSEQLQTAPPPTQRLAVRRYCRKVVRFKVLTAASVKMTDLWDIAPCLAEADRRFIGAYDHHDQAMNGRKWSTFQRCLLPPSIWWQYAPLKRRSTSTRIHGVISQKTVIFHRKVAFDTCRPSVSDNFWKQYRCLCAVTATHCSACALFLLSDICRVSSFACCCSCSVWILPNTENHQQ